MGVINDNACTRCGMENESLKHAFWDCREVQYFWSEVWQTFNEILNVQMKWDPRLLLFGLLDDIDTYVPQIYWLCLLLAKQYIWKARWGSSTLKKDKWWQNVKEVEKCERENAMYNGKLNRHIDKWGTIYIICTE